MLLVAINQIVFTDRKLNQYLLVQSQQWKHQNIVWTQFQSEQLKKQSLKLTIKTTEQLLRTSFNFKQILYIALVFPLLLTLNK